MAMKEIQFQDNNTQDTATFVPWTKFKYLREWDITSHGKSTCPCKKAANVHVNHLKPPIAIVII